MRRLMAMRGRRWTRAIGVALLASCGHTGTGFPPPCGPGIDRSDCYRASLAESETSTRKDPSVPCEPEPYPAHPLRYDRDGDRYPIHGPPRGKPECRTDCDCKRGGCAGGCFPWNRMPKGMYVCVLDVDVPEVDSFCGCVQGKCVWFEQ